MKESIISVEDALKRILDTARRLKPGKVPLASCRGLVLAEDIRAEHDMPRFTNAAMDGFAVRAGDARQAPAELRVVEEIPAGHLPARSIGPGEASRIMTGAMLPEGADAVIMMEDTESRGESVVALRPVRPGENVRPRGEEFRKGEAILRKGSVLRPYEMSLLAGEGRTEVLAYPRPDVAIIATGTELVPPDETPHGVKIRESTSTGLAALVEECGGVPRFLGIVPDEPERLRKAIAGAEGCDLLLLCAGVSMGKYDLVQSALTDLGGEVLFHNIAVKPGKPVTFGRLGRWVFFGLPGNPVSSLVAFRLFVRPAILKLRGAAPQDESMPALLALPVDIPAKRTTFLAGVVERTESGHAASPLDAQGSGMLTSLTQANCLIRIEQGAGKLPKGAPVSIIPLGGSL